MFDVVNRLPGADLSANPAYLGAGVEARRDLQGHSLAVSFNDDVLGLPGAFLHELDELIGSVRAEPGQTRGFRRRPSARQPPPGCQRAHS